MQKKAEDVKEIIFFVENKRYNKGYGNLNLYIEFLRNFNRLSPGTLNQIRFSGCEETLQTKLPNLISSLSDRDIDGNIKHKSSSSGTGLDCIFGIPCIIQPNIPKGSLPKEILQIYTYPDSYDWSQEAPMCRITNYGYFPLLSLSNLQFLENRENHFPIYPHEVKINTSTTELMKMEIAKSLQPMSQATYDTETLTQFFTKILLLAKENKIYLALSYHSAGMTKAEYYNYVNAAEQCYSDKPIIIIAPHNMDKKLSDDDKKELMDICNLRFTTNYSLPPETWEALKENVSVFEFDFLPKRLFELTCYYSNIPIYAPGASTANIAQCLNKPYLGAGVGHHMTTKGKPETLSRWEMVNAAFTFNSLRLQEVKSLLLTMSKEQIRLSARNSAPLWRHPMFAHLQLQKICDTVTDEILRYSTLIGTLIPHYFNGTDISKINHYSILSPEDQESYFTRFIDEGRLPEFCQYVCDKLHEILLDYMRRATTPGESFYELARELQQKALHPDNNMMLEVLERNLPNS